MANAGFSVLLVEDKAFNQLVMKDTLRDWNPSITIDVAENGKLAIDKLEQDAYDLILMDIQMPVMNGYEAARHIRKKMEGPVTKIPIIAVTAYSINKEDKLNAGDTIDAFISKPFDPELLFNTINRVLKEKEKPLGNSTTKTNNNSNKIVDIDALHSITKSDKERLTRVVQLFLSETPNDLTKMQASFKQGDYPSLEKVLHSLKPKFAYMGMDNLSDTTKQLQDAIRGNANGEDLEYLISKINTKCREGFKELETLL